MRLKKLFGEELEKHKNIIQGYKTNKCNATHESTRLCFKYHDEKDRRRKPICEENLMYIPKMCPEASQCSMKDKCIYAHNVLEIEFHPLNYKTKLCSAKEHKGDKYCNLSDSALEM
jgi:hypothetical protein